MLHPHHRTVSLLAAATAFAIPDAGHADWKGLVDQSDALHTDDFAFSGNHPDQVNSNENYYDGDLGDFDGDGVLDRALGSRYGLLMNTGGGLMTPYNGRTGFLIRGMPGAPGWGEDAYQWADLDNDGDLDNLCGGNGEPLTMQLNRGGRFSTAWQLSRSALNISNTDIEGDGDVDIIVAHAFCANQSCGGPVQFSLLVNDGDGNLSEQSVARGLNMAGSFIVGAVSGDIDGDGDYDILLQRGEAGNPEGSAGFVQVATNDGTGHYTLSTTDLVTTCSGFGQAFNLGDIDDDGDLDTVYGRCPSDIAASGHPTVGHVIGVNDGNGTFTNASATQWDEADAPGPLAGGNAALVDLDYDGDLDYVALDTDHAQSPTGFHNLQIFLNDGAGTFVYSSEYSVDLVSNGSALGADTDIGDLDGDGDLDIWVGIGGDRVHIMLNDYTADDGLPVDMPRDLQVLDAAADAVTIQWALPTFASNATHYNIWRATTPGLADRDRELLAVVGQRHQDEGFAAPITRHTNAAQLGNPNVSIDAAAGTIAFVDDTVIPGQTYVYTVSHIGAENSQSVQAPEVFAVVPGGSEDGNGPDITIVGPTQQDWWAYPRVVAHFGDEGSGVDPDSVRVSFDDDLGNPAAGGIAAGQDVSELAYRLDAGVIVVALAPPLAFPNNALVTMTVDAADMDGNTASATSTFFVTPTAANLPSASASASTMAGSAPLAVTFDASASTDSDGKMLRWEWYFGDGTTAIGRVVDHEFTAGGSFDVTLLVRDNDGGVATDTVTIDVDGAPAECTLGEVGDCYGGPAGTQDVGVCSGGTRQCGPAGWSDCQGEVLPQSEICDNDVDDDCDGEADAVDSDCGGPGGVDDTGDGGNATGSADGGGTGGIDGGDSQDGSGDSDGGDAGQSDDTGCSCSTRRGTPGALLLGLLALGLRRRRRG